MFKLLESPFYQFTEGEEDPLYKDISLAADIFVGGLESASYNKISLNGARELKQVVDGTFLDTSHVQSSHLFTRYKMS